MDANRTDLLGELARDAALERSDFLVRAAEQLERFLDANAARIAELGGMTLIDDDPDYLSIAPDLTFRSRDPLPGRGDAASGSARPRSSRSAPELVELYNPADIYAAFAEAAREAAGLAPEPTAADELLETGRDRPEETVSPTTARRPPTRRRPTTWAAERRPPRAPTDSDVAPPTASTTWRSRSRSGASSPRRASSSSSRRPPASSPTSWATSSSSTTTTSGSPSAGAGRLGAEVIPEGAEGEWRKLATPEELVEFYDPTDVFGDIADAIAEAYPAVAPEDDDEDDERRRGRRRTTPGRRVDRGPRPAIQRVPKPRRSRDAASSTPSSSRAGRSCPASGSSTYHAPALATSARAGQFVHVRTGDWSGLVLRRPFTVNTADPATGAISIHFREVGRGTAWLTRLRPGDRLDMLGPLGQGFQVDPRSRHLLLVAGGLGIADVRLLADEAIRDGRQVVLLYGCRERG